MCALQNHAIILICCVTKNCVRYNFWSSGCNGTNCSLTFIVSCIVVVFQHFEFVVSLKTCSELVVSFKTKEICWSQSDVPTVWYIMLVSFGWATVANDITELVRLPPRIYVVPINYSEGVMVCEVWMWVWSVGVGVWVWVWVFFFLSTLHTHSHTLHTSRTLTQYTLTLTHAHTSHASHILTLSRTTHTLKAEATRKG